MLEWVFSDYPGNVKQDILEVIFIDIMCHNILCLHFKERKKKYMILKDNLCASYLVSFNKQAVCSNSSSSSNSILCKAIQCSSAAVAAITVVQQEVELVNVLLALVQLLRLT